MPPVLRLLGRFELALGDGQGRAIAGARGQLLLARLAMARGATLDRAALCALFWADRAETQARASLRQAIWALRQDLGDLSAALMVEGDGLRLDPAVIDCELAEFERLAASTDAPDLEAALALYRGDLLEGLDLMGLAPEGNFLAERHRLRDLALTAARQLADLHAATGAWEAVLRVARRGLVLDSFDETLHARLVEALGRLGRQREARDQDRAFRARMQAELGVTLAPEPVVGPRASGIVPGAAPGLAQAARPGGGLPSALPGLLVLFAGLALAAALLWRTFPEEAALTQAAPATNLPSRNLEAYDLYLRAKAQHAEARDAADLRGAMAGYQRAFTLDPGAADAFAGYALIAVALWQRSLDLGTPAPDDRAAAYDTAGRALAVDPENARALVVLSRLQAEDGALADALATARRAAKADGDEPEVHANLALLLANSGDYAHARAELTLLQRLSPRLRPEWRLIFGEVAFADGRYDAAIADLVALWPQMPDSIPLLQHLAAALALQGRITQANTIRDALLKAMPRANLRLLALRQEGRRGDKHNARLLEGLRRAGLPEWPHGFAVREELRLAPGALAALVASGDWQGVTGAGVGFTARSDGAGGIRLGEASYVQRDATLCRAESQALSLREICGAVFRAEAGQSPGLDYVLVSADDLRYFSPVK